MGNEGLILILDRDLIVLFPAFAAFQHDGAEEAALRDGDAGMFPEFEDGQEGDDDDEAGGFVFEQFRQREGGAEAQDTDNLSDALADAHAGEWEHGGAGSFVAGAEFEDALEGLRQHVYL